MDILQKILGPEALGWAAALLTLLTLLTFFSADTRRLRLLALAGNAAFIAYGAIAQLLPVLVLHLALVPVNLWRLNQAFQRKPIVHPAKPTLAQRAARQPSGWAPARRASRINRRPVGGAMLVQQPGSGICNVADLTSLKNVVNGASVTDTTKATKAAGDHDTPCQA